MSGKKIAKTTNTERLNSACGELIFIIQTPLELHMIDESGEGRNEINIWSLKKRLESLSSLRFACAFSSFECKRKAKTVTKCSFLCYGVV